MDDGGSDYTQDLIGASDMKDRAGNSLEAKVDRGLTNASLVEFAIRGVVGFFRLLFAPIKFIFSLGGEE